MSPPLPQSVQLPAGSKVDVVLVRLPNGRIVPRHPDELLKQPVPPPARE